MDALLHQLESLEIKENVLLKALEEVHEEKIKLVKDLLKKNSSKQSSVPRIKKKGTSSIKDFSVGDRVYFSKEPGKNNVFDSKGKVLKVGKLYITIEPDIETNGKKTERRAYYNIRLVQ